MPSTGAPAVRESPRERIVAGLRAFVGSVQVSAIQRALPISFGGLIAGLVLFMATQPAETLLVRFSNSFIAAFGIMSTLLVLVLSYDLAKRRQTSPAPVVAVTFAAFAISLPYDRATSFATLMKGLGSSGLFLAIGVALLADAALTFGRKRLGYLPGSIVGGAVVLGLAIGLVLAHVSLTDALDAAIAPLGDLGDSLTALLVITALETVLWTIGIHGPALLSPVVLPVYASLQLKNQVALSHGLALPHIVTVSTFLFVFPGGAGATLPLVLLLLRSKVRRVRTVALATLLPSLANSNEPLMFGLPVVLNPILSVPFVVAPLVLATVTWWSMNLGWVAKPAYYIPYFVPVPFGAFAATLDWRSVPLALLELALAAAIYAPFVALYERHELAKERPEATPA